MLLFADASALCSILTDDDDARELLAKMRHFDKRLTSPVAVWETVVAVTRITNGPIKDVQCIVDEYLASMNIQVMSVASEIAALAIEAFDRFGKKRHSANLNFGDCAYACARHHRVPLLFEA